MLWGAADTTEAQTIRLTVPRGDLTAWLLPFTLGATNRSVVIPFLLAAMPLPVGSAVPFQEPSVIRQEVPQGFGEQVQVETFDPVARAAVLATQMPRQWTGTYESFTGAPPLTVQLSISSTLALGQMVDLRGSLTVGGDTIPVQGNLNAKSDQLDLLLLAESSAAGLENGGEFRGLQGLSLTGYRAPRFTNPGGQLVLTAVTMQAQQSSGAGSYGSELRPGPKVRGLW